jgi:GcrA cell cycle regulator
MSWTDERVELLKKMWNEGHSASQIAKELGGVTRNAVIGKVHRLGLSNRTTPEAEAKAEEPASSPAPEAKPEPAERPAAAEPKPAAAPARAPEEALAPVVDLAQAKAERAAAARASEEARDDAEEDEDIPAYQPRAIIPAGQPLPPQPSANEIDPEALATVREVEKTARKLSLLELTERTCKWPIGDPATDDFWFCGLPVKPGKPYCEAHVAVAFQPMSARRDRKR